MIYEEEIFPDVFFREWEGNDGNLLGMYYPEAEQEMIKLLEPFLDWLDGDYYDEEEEQVEEKVEIKQTY